MFPNGTASSPSSPSPSPGGCGEGGGGRGPGAGAADGMEAGAKRVPERDLERGPGQRYPHLIYSVVCLVGLCRNSMVIYVILRYYAKMKTATNIYILNLAIADELLMLSVPSWSPPHCFAHWPLSATLPPRAQSMDAVNMFTSIYCLTVLSGVDRYVAGGAPHQGRTLPPAHRGQGGESGRVGAVAAHHSAHRGLRHGGQQRQPVACNMHARALASWLVGFVLYTFLTGFLLPVGAICLCYVLIIAKMRMVALKAGWQQRKRQGARSP